jgi:hypothetical protein
MERVKNWIIATLLLVILAFGLLLTDAGHAAAKTILEVVFTDASGNDVGNTVVIGNTPSVSAAQAGAWSVGINNTSAIPVATSAATSSVAVVGPPPAPSGQTPPPPVSVESGAYSPVVLYLGAGREFLDATTAQTYTVPANTRLVVDNFCLEILLVTTSTPPAQLRFARLAEDVPSTSGGGMLRTVALTKVGTAAIPSGFGGTGTLLNYAFSGPFRAYFSAGDKLSIEVGWDTATDPQASPDVNAVIDGHLVPVAP